MGKGRPRKQGRRDKTGKLRPEFVRDKGNAVAEARRERFGTDGWDAIGRAYRSGLLGDEGQAIMDTARRLKKSYDATFTMGRIKCVLNQDGGGVMMIDLDPDSARNRQARLFDSLSAAGPRGTMKSHAFYGLVIEEHPDSGPGWLDRLIERKDEIKELRERLKDEGMADEERERVRARIAALQAATRDGACLDEALDVLRKLAA